MNIPEESLFNALEAHIHRSLSEAYEHAPDPGLIGLFLHMIEKRAT